MAIKAASLDCRPGCLLTALATFGSSVQKGVWPDWSCTVKRQGASLTSSPTFFRQLSMFSPQHANWPRRLLTSCLCLLASSADRSGAVCLAWRYKSLMGAVQQKSRFSLAFRSGRLLSYRAKGCARKIGQTSQLQDWQRGATSPATCLEPERSPQSSSVQLQRRWNFSESCFSSSPTS